MRILIHDYAGHPFQLDLSRELARRGHEVLHVYTSAYEGPKADFEAAKEGSLTVRNIEAPFVRKNKFFQRRFLESKYGSRVIRVLEQWKPELIMSANTPLDAQRKILRWAKQRKIPFVFWVQDIISVAMKSILVKRLGLIGTAVSRYYGRIEKKLLFDSDYIVSICDDFVSILSGWGIAKEKIHVIPNWAPIEQIPVLPQENRFSQKHQLTGKFVVLYAGTLGLKHDPALIMEAAEALREDPETVFVVVSKGLGMDYLKEKQEGKRLPNLLLLPFQPFERLPQVLASASVLLVILEPSAGVFSVPSKVWSGYCSARPSLLVVPGENLAAKVTSNVQAGLVITTRSSESIVSFIRSLKDNPSERLRMGENARIFAEKNFRIEGIADRFEEVFSGGHSL